MIVLTRSMYTHKLAKEKKNRKMKKSSSIPPKFPIRWRMFYPGETDTHVVIIPLLLMSFSTIFNGHIIRDREG
jgi:hypothetical protein